jgi:hypothetical protein
LRHGSAAKETFWWMPWHKTRVQTYNDKSSGMNVSKYRIGKNSEDLYKSIQFDCSWCRVGGRINGCLERHVPI